MLPASASASETRTRALADLVAALRERNLWARVVEPDQANTTVHLRVTNPGHPYERHRIVCDLGLGAVDWFWWAPEAGARDPIAPADSPGHAGQMVDAAILGPRV